MSEKLDLSKIATKFVDAAERAETLERLCKNIMAQAKYTEKAAAAHKYLTRFQIPATLSASHWAEAFSPPITSIEANFSRMQFPIFDVFKDAKALGPLTKNWPKFDYVPGFVRDLEENFKFASRFASDWVPFFERSRRAALLDRAGWLPHSTIPLHLLDDTQDDEPLGLKLEEYYRNNWTGMRQQIEASLSGCHVDNESEACFAEALDAHENERYRSVCRLIFPEIERVVRIRFHGNQFGNITNVKMLRRFAGELPLSDLGYFELFRRLEKHIYDDVRTTEALKRLEGDTVPNRHAAVHGLICYSRFVHSINSLFMALYVYKIIYLSGQEDFEDRNTTSRINKRSMTKLADKFDISVAGQYKAFLEVVRSETTAQFWTRMKKEAKANPHRFSTPIFQRGPSSLLSNS